LKVKVWGARGSIPSPLTPEDVRQKLIAALQGARQVNLGDPIAIRAYVEELHPVLSGTTGGNTPCVELQVDEKEIIIDAGSGIRSLGHELMAGPCGKGQGVIHLFLSHTHWDHIQGLPFFVPAFIPGNKLFIYSVHDVEKTIADQMSPATFPVNFDYMRSRSTVEFVRLEPNTWFNLDSLRIGSMLLPHPGDAYAYRFEHRGNTVVYASDGEYKKLDDLSLQPFVKFYSGADVLFFDSQFSLRESLLKEDWGHSSALIGAELARKSNVKQLVLFHHDPLNSDEELVGVLKQTQAYQQNTTGPFDTEVQIGYEGLEFDLDPSGPYELEYIAEKHIAILHISPSFDQETVAEVLDRLGESTGRDPVNQAAYPRLIVDLCEVKHLSLSGLRSLIDLRRLWEGQTMALASLTVASQQMIELANFLDLFAIYQSVNSALSSIEAHDKLELKGELLDNRYRIEEKLGQSELSVIFRSTDTRLDRPVILKILSPSLSQEATKRLLQQTRNIARLRAPNIVTIYDWDEEWGLAYLVMEYVGNQTLRDLFARGTVSEPEKITDAILSALEVAHGKGAIHGNLKPENVIIADEVKLTDFGFWWMEPGKPITEAAIVFGDPNYLAPEQILGLEFDARADLYALGVILFELYTGRPPFLGSTREKISSLLNGPPEQPAKLNPQMSEALNGLILKLLSRDPAERYQSIHQVRTALQAARLA